MMSRNHTQPEDAFICKTEGSNSDLTAEYYRGLSRAVQRFGFSRNRYVPQCLPATDLPDGLCECCGMSFRNESDESDLSPDTHTAKEEGFSK